MKEKTIIKFMNKLGVSTEPRIQTNVVAGGYRYCIRVEEAEPVVITLVELCGSVNSPITKAYILHNKTNICSLASGLHHLVFSNKTIYQLQAIDTIISRRTADANALAILVYVELMNVDIRIDKVVDYFESIDIAKELQQYVSDSGMRDDIPLPLTKFLRNDTSKTLVTPVDLADIIKISEYGDPLLLHVAIKTLYIPPTPYPDIKHMILVDCMDEVSAKLWDCMTEINTIPNIGDLQEMITGVISERADCINDMLVELGNLEVYAEGDIKLTKAVDKVIKCLKVKLGKLDRVM